MSKIYPLVPNILILSTVSLVAFTVGYLIFLILAFLGVIEPFTNIYTSVSSMQKIGWILLGISLSKVFLIITLSLLINILWKIRKNEPFEKQTVRRFYLLGLLIFLMPFVESIPLYIGASFNYISSEIIGYNAIINRIGSFIILGILMLTFASVMKLGFKVAEEQKLTV